MTHTKHYKLYFWRFIKFTSLIFLFLYLCACIWLYLNQRNIIYIPSPTLLAPSEYGLTNTKEVTLKTEDGILITSWYSFLSTQNKTLIYFQGNNLTLGNRVQHLDRLMKEGFNILAVSYRGYGTSGGSPSEQGLYNDGRAAIHYLLNQNIPLKNIVLYGESLGTGVAIELGTEFNVGAIILESPYTSLVSIGYKRYPIIPISLLLKDRFDSKSKIAHIQSPLLIFHGLDDHTVPAEEGKLLLELAPTPKHGIFYEHVGHSNFDLSVLAKEVKLFTDQY